MKQKDRSCEAGFSVHLQINYAVEIYSTDLKRGDLRYISRVNHVQRSST